MARGRTKELVKAELGRTASADAAPGEPDPIDVGVGRRIRIRRLTQRVSQSQLGEYLQVSFQQIQKYERGANRVSASMLVRIAECLETTVAELVGETPSDREPDSTLDDRLATPGAIELLRFYAGIDNQALRRAVLDLARTLNESQPFS